MPAQNTINIKPLTWAIIGLGLLTALLFEECAFTYIGIFVGVAIRYVFPLRTSTGNAPKKRLSTIWHDFINS